MTSEVGQGNVVKISGIIKDWIDSSFNMKTSAKQVTCLLMIYSPECLRSGGVLKWAGAFSRL